MRFGRAASFTLCSGVLFAAFSFLWVLEYRVRFPDAIDAGVIPCGWLAAFFVASYYYVRGKVALPVVFSAYLSVVFSGLLILFIGVFLAPFYGPWF